MLSILPVAFGVFILSFSNIDGKVFSDVEAEEVDADEQGSDKALEKKIDFIKALKIEETRIRSRLKKVIETRTRVLRSL